METISAPSASPSALFTWASELAYKSCSNLYVLCGEDGNAVFQLEAGIHGRLDAIIETDEPVPYTDELETLAYKAMSALEANGSHAVRRTSAGVRAFLKADWTRKYTGRVNDAPPAGFDPSEHRPYYLQPHPEVETPKKSPKREWWSCT
jgi:hypothetical protein